MRNQNQNPSHADFLNAIRNDDLLTVQNFLNQGFFNPFLPQPCFSFHNDAFFAASTNSPSCLKYFLTLNPNFAQSLTPDGQTPLEVALHYRSLQSSQILLQHTFLNTHDFATTVLKAILRCAPELISLWFSRLSSDLISSKTTLFYLTFAMTSSSHRSLTLDDLSCLFNCPLFPLKLDAYPLVLFSFFLGFQKNSDLLLKLGSFYESPLEVSCAYFPTELSPDLFIPAEPQSPSIRLMDYFSHHDLLAQPISHVLSLWNSALERRTFNGLLPDLDSEENSDSPRRL